MKKFTLILLIASFSSTFVFSQSETEKTILLEIREMRKEHQEFKLQTEKRLTAIETRFEGINQRFEGINQRFEGINQRFEEVNKRIDILLYIMIAILTGIFGLIGFVVWDRQVSLKPIKEDNKGIKREVEILKEKEEKIEMALRNLANIEPKFIDALRNSGIL